MKETKKILFLILISASGITLGQSFNDEIALNEIQLVGSHNSYKKALDPSLMFMLSIVDENIAMSLDYSHKPLAEQLDFGIRSLEIDVYFDPRGGRYKMPLWHKRNPFSSDYDDNSVMEKPGFKVMHVQDLDFRSHCLSLEVCLKQIKTWSIQNPKHLPLIITINPKDDTIPQKGFVRPIPFTDKAWADLDNEFRSVLGDTLIVPDDIRGDYLSLRAAVLAGWPSLKAMRGKVLLVLDASESKTHSYIQGHKMLAGRVMFVDMPEDSELASFRVVNNPIENLEYIQNLIKQGFIVRTRADAETIEARSGNNERLKKAIESGAQIISTDYYHADERFSDYHVELKEKVLIQCNPILKAIECVLSSR